MQTKAACLQRLRSKKAIRRHHRPLLRLLPRPLEDNHETSVQGCRRPNQAEKVSQGVSISNLAAAIRSERRYHPKLHLLPTNLSQTAPNQSQQRILSPRQQRRLRRRNPADRAASMDRR